MAHAPESFSYSGPVSQSNDAVMSQQSTKQLDFYQAMQDFKIMFPGMEDDIIEAVLRANNGAVDGTIDQLLTMNIDSEDQNMTINVAAEEVHHPVIAKPPSYNETINHGIEREVEKKSGLPPDLVAATLSETKPNEPEVDLLSADIETFNFSSACVNSNSVTPSHKEISKPEISEMTLNRNSLSFDQKPSGCDSNFKACHGRDNTFVKRPYRKWNPPLLGTLPDDFLRLSEQNLSSKKHSGFGRQNLNVTTQDNAIHSTVFIQGRSPSPNSVSQSPPRLPPRRHTSHASDKKKGSTLLRRTQSELNSAIIKKKMADNVQRRTSMHGSEVDPAVLQELEDEHLALMMQNKEFLDMLRKDKDFMKTLERDRMNATAFDFGPEPPKVNETYQVKERVDNEPIIPLPFDESVIAQGYGDDKSQSIGAFPYTKELPVGADGKDVNAEFKRQLNNMGQSSKNKFQALAKKFFSRRKRTARHVLRESAAPSTLNLLDGFDDDDEFNDEVVKESKPEFEPLPGVPYYKTVQRPPYKPDCVVTYHDDNEMV